MMLGEHHRPNPTVQIPPWPLHDESNADTYSPSPLGTNVSSASDYSPYYMQEAFRALQRYLPSNDPDFDSDSDQPDSAIDAYTCDHFRMYEFKVRRCARGRSHDWTECPFAHPGEKARRRDPRKFHYSGTACPDFRKGNCKKGDSCEFAHGVFECWLHPARYRTQPCKDGVNCRRRVCFFAHTPDQLRVLSPKSFCIENSYDGSPQRTSCMKSLPFLASPSSISPPGSPSGESPPMSPMTGTLSRSLGSSSINEMVANMRNLHLDKLKSLPSSYNVQVGGSPGYGSPRGSILRPGCSSLPTTPTRVPGRSVIGFSDCWGGVGDDEPVMERVESGRELRAKMFEKLSKENSLESVGTETGLGQSGNNGPDVGWVSDLLN